MKSFKYGGSYATRIEQLNLTLNTSGSIKYFVDQCAYNHNFVHNLCSWHLVGGYRSFLRGLPVVPSIFFTKQHTSHNKSASYAQNCAQNCAQS